MIESSQLAAYVASRVCHDLVSPVSSAMSALDLMDEPNDTEMHAQAEALLKKGLEDAAAKLEFLRYAFGTQGLHAGAADMHQAKSISERYVTSHKPSIEWDIETAHFSYSHVRLMMNLIMIGVDCLSWGGVMTVLVRDEGSALSIVIDAKGKRTQISKHTVNGLAGTPPENGWEGRSIQPVFAQQIAKDLDSEITVNQISDEHVVIAAKGIRAEG